jgi:hypothetical protein
LALPWAGAYFRNTPLQMELVLGVQFRHQLHLECELTVEKMWGGGGGKAGSTLEPALVHPITEHWRATFRGGKGPSTLAGLFHSTYLKIPNETKMGKTQKWVLKCILTFWALV